MANEFDQDQLQQQTRTWDDEYQSDVAGRIRAIRDELLTVDGAAVVARDLTSALRGLPA